MWGNHIMGGNILKKQEILKKIKGKLIVSCQALEEEPLHSDFIMSKMALAADMAGAGGIRANTI
jgi:N-acylglucosamine-6-phosphate 2-epimerase